MTTILPALTGENFTVIADLAETIWTEHYTPIIGAKQVAYMLNKFQSVSAIQNQVEKGISYYLISFQDTYVGYFSFSIEENHLFLSKLYVLKSARGNKIGKAALSFIEEQAEALELNKIKLTVNKYNTNAIKAYEKIGFINIEAIVQDIGNGFVMDDYVLEKNLG
ncbi:GNAT family N-acetyltransferase [Muriicola sp. Z0-33]|uniref:GNAT family N-acetyltransferase n=1 Tax=Muriicola sp. Z0-33 TaxID=2816957 RepID=UPI0022378E00|nr:GNAT family N-acetyltransferase [Muriicola sp. Z0-33]MCW5516035.1 GNAT family N-acetyltransferase [Muriicola sp. Z0-33]